MTTTGHSLYVNDVLTELARVYGVTTSDEDLSDLTHHVAQKLGITDAPDADVTVWRVTRQDILDRCSGERVLPITDEQYEQIAKAIDFSSVSECIEGAIGQVVPYIDEEEPA